MACGRVEGIVPDESDFTIRFYTGIDYTTKSKDPEETYIHDINLFIFDDKGNPSLWWSEICFHFLQI